MEGLATTLANLRIGFVPGLAPYLPTIRMILADRHLEHFSTPLFYATQHYSLAATLRPFPTGTGAMIAALRADEIDVAIGLTEALVAGLRRRPGDPADAAPGGGYRLVGTYVQSPLNWAVSTGAGRSDVKGIDVLKGGKLGVSRMGR